MKQRQRYELNYIHGKYRPLKMAGGAKWHGRQCRMYEKTCVNALCM